MMYCRLKVIVCLLLVAGAATAEWSMPADVQPPGPVRFSVTESGFETVSANGGVVIRLPDQGARAEAGAPDLPVLVKVLPVASDYSLQVRIEDSPFEDTTDISVVPVETWSVDDPEAEHPVPMSSRIPAADIYSSTSFWPRELARIEEAWMGTQKLARIEIRPVQYNPSTRTLRFFRRLAGEIVFVPESASGKSGP